MKSGFITFEGIDGCGKTSLIRKVADRLEKAGFSVELTREPTDTWLGDAVRQGYKEDISPYTEAFLFLADRATHTDRIRKQVAEGKVVMSDRYSDSTVAYQAAFLNQRLGGKCETYMEWLKKVSEPVVIEPDITFLLDVDPETSLGRLRNRSQKEKFETLENLRQVRRNYLAIAETEERVHVIDASRGIPEVLGDILFTLGEHFGSEL